jgi:hypothetical protein
VNTLVRVIHSRLHGAILCARIRPLVGTPGFQKGKLSLQLATWRSSFAVRKFASGSAQESFFAISSNLPDSKMTCDSV